MATTAVTEVEWIEDGVTSYASIVDPQLAAFPVVGEKILVGIDNGSRIWKIFLSDA